MLENSAILVMEFKALGKKSKGILKKVFQRILRYILKYNVGEPTKFVLIFA